MQPTMTAAADAELRNADRLVSDGRPLEAVRLLSEANRRERSTAIERRLVSIRHEAFDAVERRSIDDLPAAVRAAPERAATLPDTSPSDLTVTSLHDGLAEHGCVLVRGLIPPERAARLADGIDRALAGFDSAVADDAAASASAPDHADDDGWYAPFTPRAGTYRVGGRRQWVRASGALWTADSPRMLAELFEVIDDTGIGALVTEYLGERPVLSANKCTLRRVPVTSNAGWHQDGAFLGEDVRSLNLWLSLAHCGTDAPGLDVVPRRFDHVLETGTGGAFFDWAVGDDVVAEAAGDAGVVRPQFGPGDALLFDHLFLHRTAVSAGMTNERHAIETWLFSPSSYPDGQIPIVY